MDRPMSALRPTVAPRRIGSSGPSAEAMTFIKLTSTEIEAVVAYLQFLGEQP